MRLADTFRSGLRAGRDLLLWGAVTGLLVYGIGIVSLGQSFDAGAALLSIGIATLYVALMGSFMSLVDHWVSRRVPLRSQRAVAVHTVAQAVSVLVSFILVTALLKLLLGPYFMVEWVPLLIVALVAFSAALIGSSFSTMQRFHRRMREAEAAAYEAQLQALRAQINPHFLFNAFNSIAALIRTRPDAAETVVEDLSDLFRYTLRASKQESATLGAELRAARLYLKIEQVRFRERLQVNLDVPTVLRTARMPSMTLQPLVENAVKHGAGQTPDPCTLCLCARREGNQLHLRVTDTGPGFDTTDLDDALSRGTGLANVCERLRLFFDGEAALSLLPQGVELTMPLRTAREALPPDSDCPAPANPP